MTITDSMGKTLGDPGPSREGCSKEPSINFRSANTELSINLGRPKQNLLCILGGQIWKLIQNKMKI